MKQRWARAARRVERAAAMSSSAAEVRSAFDGDITHTTLREPDMRTPCHADHEEMSHFTESAKMRLRP